MWTGLLLVVCPVFFAARAAEVRVAAKKFQNSLGQQNLQTVLMSIEERLRNLDSVYSMQYSPSVEGKLEHYGRKLENVEAKIARMEAVMRNELDKISENISSKNFRDDIAKDHVLRKIDSVYERINSRLVYAEIRLEMAERKLEDKLEMVLSRLDKVEDDISTKDANTAVEFADVIAVLDDIKPSIAVIEGKIANLTVLINSSHHHHAELAQKVEAFRADDLKQIRANLEGISLINENFTAVLRNEIKEEFNLFANKVVDFHDSAWKSYDRLEKGLRSISTVVNLTRFDLQNGFRSLTVQVGKKQTSNMLSDSQKDVAILENMDKKIDSNFESVMLAQNLFLESCYRLQKDESQLETKISEVLEKLIDTFEQKTALQPSDLKNLEQMIRNHDLNARKSSSNLANSVGALLQKADANGRKMQDNLDAFRNTIEELYALVQSKFGVYDENKLGEVISVLKDVRTHLLAIDAQIKQDAQRSGLSVSDIKDLKTILVQLQNMTQLEPAVIQNLQDNVKYIYHALYSIELKLNKSYLDYYFDKYNVEVVAHRFGRLLDEYVQNVEKNLTDRGVFRTDFLLQNFTTDKNKSIAEVLVENQTDRGKGLNQTISEVLGQSNDTLQDEDKRNASIAEIFDKNFMKNQTERERDLDLNKVISDIFRQRNVSASSDDNKTETTTEKSDGDQRKLISEIFGLPVENGTALPVVVFETEPDRNATERSPSRNCSIYDIDIRLGDDGDCPEQEEDQEQNATVYPVYDIDVRFSGGSSSNESEAYQNDGDEKSKDISTILNEDEMMSYFGENATETLDYSQTNGGELDYEHEYDELQ